FVMMSADFFAISGSGFASLPEAFLALSVPHLVISSLTLSAHALSLQSHIFFWTSSLLAPASPAAPLPFLQPKVKSDAAATNAIVSFCILGSPFASEHATPRRRKQQSIVFDCIDRSTKGSGPAR